VAGPRYLLDTNILSSLLKQPAGRAANRIRSVGEDAVCTSVIVSCELRYGAAKKGSAELSKKVEQLLSALEVLPLGGAADAKYAELRAALEKAGTPIGANDYLIAAHALALDLTLVTANVDEFSCVRGLRVENWLEPIPRPAKGSSKKLK
jgi:tRNA(fMet)-specific endonuclease VapC